MLNEVLAVSGLLGGYVALWKILVFLVFFWLWSWVGQWFDRDARQVPVNRMIWSLVYLGCGTTVLLLWFFLPAPFVVHVLLFVVVWATVSGVYVMHRNSQVAPNETILNRDHIRWLLSADRKKDPEKLRLVFISVNNNELPTPYQDDPEYPGYIYAEEMLHDMWQRRVTHGELVPAGEMYELRYIIDGIRNVEDELERDAGECSIGYLKRVAGLDVEDHRRPQSGSFFTIRTGDVSTAWRIRTSGSTRGEQLFMERIEEVQTMDLGTIGLMTDQTKLIKEITAQRQGIVLVAGPEGSGVTTTLYSLLRCHDAFVQNLCTFELETFTELDVVTQNIVDSESSASHGRQLQSVLHADPDVVMVGFCDDPDMAKLGTQAARSGKKFYFGVKAGGMFQALQLWMKLVEDNKKVAETLVAITSQKLLRKLCTECREAYEPDPALLKKLNLPVDKIEYFYRPPELEYDRRGNPLLCPNCQGTGYYERTAVFEIMMISDGLRELITNGSPIKEIRAQCRKEKTLYIQEQAVRKVIKGITSIQEVLRVTVEGTQRKSNKK